MRQTMIEKWTVDFSLFLLSASQYRVLAHKQDMILDNSRWVAYTHVKVALTVKTEQ